MLLRTLKSLLRLMLPFSKRKPQGTWLAPGPGLDLPVLPLLCFTHPVALAALVPCGAAFTSPLGGGQRVSFAGIAWLAEHSSDCVSQCA